MTELQERHQEILGRIADAALRSGRTPDAVTLVAVSKNVPLPRLEEAYRLGIRTFGENRVQEAKEKVPFIPKDARWHLIGPLQTNKARLATELFQVIETLDRPRLVDMLVALRERGWSLPQLLVEVNVGREPQKAGVLPEDLEALLAYAYRQGIYPQGLMTIPPRVEDQEAVRPYFRALRELRDRLRPNYPHLVELSMGMSQDFEVAIEEGATIVRIGTALFGERGDTAGG